MAMVLSDLLTKARRNLLKKWKKDSSVNFADYWESIDDIPLNNWIKCNDGDLTYARKIQNVGTPEQDVLAWDAIFNQYIKEFGLGKLHKKMLEAMKKRAMLELDFVMTGDRFKLTLIEMEVARIEQMVANAGSGMTIHEALIHLSKWMGTMINTKNITAREYFTLLNEYGKANKVK